MVARHVAEASVDKPVSKQVNLTPAARRVLDRIKEDFGITQLAATERGLEFLLTLPAPVLQEVFRTGGDPVGTLVRIKQAELAGAGDAPTVEQSVAVIRSHLAKLERIAKGYRELVEESGPDDTSKKKRAGKTRG